MDTRKIFIRSAGAWLLLGVLLNSLFSHEKLTGVVVFFGVWLVALVDLIATIYLVDRLTQKTQGTGFFSSSLFLGIVKVACLAFLGVVLWSGQSLPVLSVLSGLATLVVVPIIGGIQLQKR
jgi:hypothetical protein